MSEPNYNGVFERALNGDYVVMFREVEACLARIITNTDKFNGRINHYLSKHPV